MARRAKTSHFAMCNSYAQCIRLHHVRAWCRRHVRNVLQPIANTADILQEMLTVLVCGSRQVCRILTAREKRRKCGEIAWCCRQSTVLQCRLERSYPNFDIWHCTSHNHTKTAVNISSSFLYFLATDGKADTHRHLHFLYRRGIFISWLFMVWSLTLWRLTTPIEVVPHR